MKQLQWKWISHFRALDLSADSAIGLWPADLGKLLHQARDALCTRTLRKLADRRATCKGLEKGAHRDATAKLVELSPDPYLVALMRDVRLQASNGAPPGSAWALSTPPCASAVVRRWQRQPPPSCGGLPCCRQFAHLGGRHARASCILPTMPSLLWDHPDRDCLYLSRLMQLQPRFALDVAAPPTLADMLELHAAKVVSALVFSRLARLRRLSSLPLSSPLPHVSLCFLSCSPQACV